MMCTYRIQLLFLFSIIAFLYIILVIQYNIWKMHMSSYDVESKNYVKTKKLKTKVIISNAESVKYSSKDTIASSQKHSSDINEYKILFWQSVHIPTENLQNCPYKNCRVTQDKQQIGTSNAIVMTTKTLINEALQRPISRNPNQTWILFNMDPPTKVFLKTDRHNGLFNATATYLRTADIFIPLVEIVHKNNPQTMGMKKVNYSKGKTKLVATFLDHCTLHSERERYIRSLQEHLDVDIYGKCGNIQCPDKEGHPAVPEQRMPRSCFTSVAKSYKFFLAFEDSLCEDYVSRTLWYPLQYNIIPVVLGMANYSNTLPLHSYINVQDFKSAELLAGFLRVLNQHDELYNAYFMWKHYYKVKYWKYSNTPVCNICEYMNTKSPKRNRVKEQWSDFWNRSKHCVKSKKFYKDILPAK